MENIHKNNFVSLFSEQFSGNSDFDLVVSSLKKQALLCFSNNGLPTPKNEEWKYANLSFLNNFDFKINKDARVTIDIVDSFKFYDLKANIIVFLDGRFAPEFSNIIDKNIEFECLSEKFKSSWDSIKDYYGKSFDVCNDAFLSLNTAFADDGAVLTIKKSSAIENPIHIMQIFSGEEEAGCAFPRNLIIAEESSEVKIIETYHKIGTNKTFSASVTEIFLKANSKLDFSRIEIFNEDHFFIGKSYVAQSKDTVFNDITFTLDGKFVRNNLYTKHEAENAETHFFGFYFASGNSFIDNHTFVDHSMPNCNSNEVYKGIISDHATAVFNGKILVRPDAQKTNAYQSNKNVLLSDGATINTKPELEIYADDVKCSHGATSGSLDKEHLFYLRARGIDEDSARALLLSAFGEEIIDKIKIESVQNKLSDIFEAKLSGKI